MGGIDGIKVALSAEMDKTMVSKDFKTPANIEESLIRLHENPDAEKGDKLRWNVIDLTLKPEIYLLTGIPSCGKSTWLDNIMVNSALDHQYKWGIFSPESHPVELHMKQIVEIATETNFAGAYNHPKTTTDHIRKVCKKFNDSIFMITPSEEDSSIEYILGLFEYLVEEKGANAFVLDPYNEFSHTRPSSMSETEYVSRFLGKIRRFVNKHNVMVWIVAHPTKLRKEEHINYLGAEVNDYPVPTAYDVAGSANFFNKPDVIISVHRDKNIDRNPNNIVSINVQKVRRKTTGKLGQYLLKFNYNTGTYASYNA